MGEEIKPTQIPAYNDVNRACTRWLIQRGIYVSEMSFRQANDAEVRAALKKRLAKERAIDRIDRIVDDLARDD